MNILKPFYYDDFKCVGGGCKDSCCIGWNIYIDKKSYKAYKNVKGEYYKKLKDGISRNRKDSDDLHYGDMKLENGKCKFLNKQNLCDIYIDLGQEYLCNTCKIYPRVINKNGDIYEKGLKLSCPEVARMFVELKDIFSFDMENRELNKIEKQYTMHIENFKYNKDLYKVLWEGRSLSIEVAQFTQIDIWKRLVFINIIAEKLQNLINENKYNTLSRVIDELRTMCTDYEVIVSLDNIEKVDEIKMKFVNILLQRRMNIGAKNKTFIKLLEEFNEFFEKYDNIESCFKEKESRFNVYFKKYEKILENYIVYSLYNTYMECLYNKLVFDKSILYLTLSYSTIKTLLMTRWNKNNENLTNEDIIDVLYSFSRVIEHDEIFIQSLYDDLKVEGYISLPYLTILVR